MSIATLSINFLGIFLFLFIFWEKLKEDYSSDIVFSLGSSILIGGAIGLLITTRLLNSYFLWGLFLGSLTGLFITAYKFKLKFYEAFENFVVASLPWLGLFFLTDSVVHSSLSSFLGFIGILFLIFISYYFDTHYKSFNWYKSGKIGFTGISTLAIIFLVRIILAILKIHMLSLVNQKIEIILSGIGIAFCSLFLIKLANEKI